MDYYELLGVSELKRTREQQQQQQQPSAEVSGAKKCTKYAWYDVYIVDFNWSRHLLPGSWRSHSVHTPSLRPCVRWTMMRTWVRSRRRTGRWPRSATPITWETAATTYAFF